MHLVSYLVLVTCVNMLSSYCMGASCFSCSGDRNWPEVCLNLQKYCSIRVCHSTNNIILLCSNDVLLG